MLGERRRQTPLPLAQTSLRLEQQTEDAQAMFIDPHRHREDRTGRRARGGHAVPETTLPLEPARNPDRRPGSVRLADRGIVVDPVSIRASADAVQGLGLPGPRDDLQEATVVRREHQHTCVSPYDADRLVQDRSGDLLHGHRSCQGGRGRLEPPEAIGGPCRVGTRSARGLEEPCALERPADPCGNQLEELDVAAIEPTLRCRSDVQHAGHVVGAEDRHADDRPEAFAEPGAHDLDPGDVLDHDRCSLGRDPSREAFRERDRNLFGGDPFQPIGRADVQGVPLEHQERRAVRRHRLPDPSEERLESVVGVEPLQRRVADGEHPGQRMPAPRFALEEPRSFERLGRLPHHRLERGAIFGGEGRLRAADREHAHGTPPAHQGDEPPPVIRRTLAARAWFQPPSPPRSERLLDVSGDRRGGRGGDHLGIQFAIGRYDGQHVVFREQDHGRARCTDRLSRGRQQGLDHLGLGHALGDGSGESLEARQTLQNHPQLHALRRQGLHQLIAFGLRRHAVADVLDDGDDSEPLAVGADDHVRVEDHVDPAAIGSSEGEVELAGPSLDHRGQGFFDVLSLRTLLEPPREGRTEADDLVARDPHDLREALVHIEDPAAAIHHLEAVLQ